MKNSTNPNYTSLVTKYDFSELKENQEKELEINPLMIRFKESRENFKNDKFRPTFHYINPESTLNDPNGLCFWQGHWHLFYQAYPPEDTRQHWGHAVSSDLIHWQDLPFAIYPDPEECCFSGSTLVEKDRVIAMYHGTKVGNMIATSSDPLLLNWKKLGDGPVIPFPDSLNEAEYSVFDPCIWRKKGKYYSLSGGTLPNGPANKQIRANFLFCSDDLIEWQYLHPFVENDMYSIVGDDGACPYFWPIGDKHMLLFFSHMSGGQYLTGDYDQDRDKFVVTNGGKFNFGPSRPSGVHAPSATPDGKSGIITIFNMNEGIKSNDWDQIMSLPRRLQLGKEDQLKIEPAGEIESLRYDHYYMENKEIQANHELVLEGIEGNTVELNLEIDPKDANLVEVNVLRSPNKEEFTRITFFKDRGYNYRFRAPNRTALNANSPLIKNIKSRQESLLTIDTSYSSILPDSISRAPETAPVHLDDQEILNLRIFIDRSVLEVFINGKQCVSVRVYPGRDDSLGISLYARGSAAKLIKMDAWKMKSIYE